MILSICYVFVFIVSIILITLIKKSCKPVNAIAMLFSSFVALLSYDALCALAMTIIRIPVDLFSIMICNILLIAVIALIIIKRKGREVFYLPYVDLLFTFLLFIIVFSVGYHIFNGFTIGYNSGDSTNHFTFAMRTLLTKRVSAMFFNPLYNALFTEVCAPFIRASRIFIPITISDTFMLFCVAEMIYLVITQRIKSNIHKALAFIITVLCIFGYPMYSYSVGGFLYLTCALFISCYIIYWLRQYAIGEFKNSTCLLFIVTGCISLVFTYAVIAPLVIGAVIITLSIHRFAQLTTKERKKFLMVLFVCVIATSVFMIIIIVLYLKAEGQPVSIGSAIHFFTQAFRSDGYMYSRVYSDLLFLFPAIIVAMIRAPKNKDVVDSFTFFYVLFVIICFLLCAKGYMSGYYYFKTYFILWILGWICVGNWIFDSSQAIANRIAYFSTIIFICLTSFFSIENRIYCNYDNIASHHEGFVEEAKIYLRVHDSIFKEYDSWWMTDDYMQILEYFMDENPDKNCALIADKDDSNVELTIQHRLFEYITGDFTRPLSEYDRDTIRHNFSALALHRKSQYVASHKDWFDDLDVLFENDTFIVVSTDGL